MGRTIASLNDRLNLSGRIKQYHADYLMGWMLSGR